MSKVIETQVFVHEEGAWDISLMRRHAKLLRFGRPVRVDTSLQLFLDDAILDPAKVKAIMGLPHVLAEPMLAVDLAHTGTRLVVDGRHRFLAHQALGHPCAEYYVVPASQEHRYRLDLPSKELLR